MQACRQGGASIAAVALANGLNANMVRKWVSEAEAREVAVAETMANAPATTSDKAASSAPVQFLPLAMPASAAPASAQEIHIELQRSATTIKVAWPTTAAADCAAWLRELLR